MWGELYREKGPKRSRPAFCRGPCAEYTIKGDSELEDDEIHERSLVIRDPRDRHLVTVIELLSPTNKVLNSFGRESFLKKRREIKSSDTHWLEIDLLRGGARTANLPRVPESDYQVYLSRAGHPRTGFAWPIRLEDRLPVITIPLQEVLATVIERGSYDLDTDYNVDPIPPLTPAQKKWARKLIAAMPKEDEGVS